MSSHCVDWLESEAVRFQNRASFEDAIFSGRFLQYSWYRLKYFFILQGLQLIVHLIEFFFLYWVAEDHSFRSIAVILSILFLMQSGWWGGLERFRDAIRQLRFHGLLYKAPRIIRKWHSAGECLVSMLFVCTLLLALFYSFLESRTFISAVLLMYGVRVSSGMYLATLQAATYAIRRTYFPIGALVSVEIVGVFAFLAAWYAVGIWGMVISHVLVTFIQSAIRYKYIRYTYQGLRWRFTPVHVWKSPLRGMKNLKRIIDRDFLIQYCSAGLMSTDTLIVFSFFVAASRMEAYHTLFMLFFLISPLIRASHNWTRLFYFDLKKVDLDLYKIYKQHAESQIGKLAMFLAILFATVGAICLLITDSPEPQFLAFLYLFFVSHSLFSYLQMKLFCSHRHIMVISSSVVLLLFTLILPKLELNIFHPVLLLSFCFLITWYLFRIIAGKKTIASGTLNTTPYPEWVSLAMRANEGLNILLYEIEEKAPITFTSQILELLAGTGGSGFAVTCYRSNVILALGSDEKCELAQRTVQSHSYGFLKKPVMFALSGSELGNLKQLEQKSVLPSGFYSSYSIGEKTTLSLAETRESLKEIFKAMFPEGDIYEVSTYKDRRRLSEENLSTTDASPVLIRAMRYAQSFVAFHSISQEFVCAFCPQGEMNIIFRMKKIKRCRERWKLWENILLSHSLTLTGPSICGGNSGQR